MGEGEDGAGGGDGGFEFAGVQEGGGEVDAGDVLAVVAVVFAGFGALGVEVDGLVEVGDGFGVGGGELGGGGAGEVVVAGAGEAELAADVQEVVGVVEVAGLGGLRDLGHGGVGVAEAGGGAGAHDVELGGVGSGGQVVQAGPGEVEAASRVAGPQGDDGEVEAELGDEGAVVDGEGVGESGAGEFFGGGGVAEAFGGVGHEAVEGAEEEVELDFVAGPEFPVQGGVHLLADAAHLEEQGEWLAGHVLA